MQSNGGQQRTELRLIDAYNQLVFDKTPETIRVRDIVERAGVGRSTFYEHFSSAEALHMRALSRPMSSLADVAAGIGPVENLERLLGHFWQNRARARETLAGKSRERVTRTLAELLDQRVELSPNGAIPRRMTIAQLAEAMLAPMRLWILGEAAVTPAQLAAALERTATALRDVHGLKPRPISNAL